LFGSSLMDITVPHERRFQVSKPWTGTGSEKETGVHNRRNQHSSASRVSSLRHWTQRDLYPVENKNLTRQRSTVSNNFIVSVFRQRLLYLASAPCVRALRPRLASAFLPGTSIRQHARFPHRSKFLLLLDIRIKTHKKQNKRKKKSQQSLNNSNVDLL